MIYLTKKIITRTVIRTIFYQTLIIFTCLSIGFIFNAEYIGNRSPIIYRSIDHTFFPKYYNEEVENILLNVGRSRLASYLEFDEFEIISEKIESQKYYMAMYEYKDGIYDFNTKINWQPWESNFPKPN